MNYSLVIDSKFDPFTYQELLHPVMTATQAHQQLEDAYGELATKANVWKNMANAQTDERTYKQYKAYVDDLQNQVDTLAREGLNPSSRRSLINMKSRYSSEIIPIEQAYQRRKQLADEQRQGKAKGLIYDYDAETTSLDAFVFDHQKDYDSIDLNTLYTKSKDSFSNIAKELSNYGKGKPIDAYTDTFIQQHGITREQAARFADDIRAGNLDTSNPALRAIYNSLYSGTNVNTWNNRQAEQQVMNTILSGATSAIGQTNISSLENYGSRLAAQEAKEKRMAQFQQNLANPNPTPPEIPINKYKKRNSFSIKEREEFFKHWEYLKRYMYKDAKGRWRMTSTGRRKYAAEFEKANQSEYIYVPGVGEMDTGRGLESGFVKAVKALGLQGLATASNHYSGWGPNQQAIIDKYKGSTVYDANKYTEYYRAIDNSDRGSLLRALQRAGKGGGTPTAEWTTDRKAGQYLKFGKKVDLSTLEDKDIKDAITVVGQNGSYYEVTLSDNSTIRVPIKSVFGDYESRIVGMNNTDFNELDWNDAISYDLDNSISSFGTTAVESRKLKQQ